MQVNLRSIVQTIDLNNGAMKNSIVVELPNGETAIFPIDEASLDAILRAQRGDGQPPPAPIEETSPSYGLQGEDAELVPPADADSTAVFGGVPAPPPPPQPVQRQRARQVGMDEWGYPRVPQEAGTKDPGEVVGGSGGDSDEDGVNSI